MKVGFIGLGRMGQGMAARVLGAGHEVTGYNRSPEKAASLAERGARTAGSVAGAVADAEVVITMLSTDGALAELAHAPDGMIASMRPGAIHAGMGTHGVDICRSLAAAHAAAGQSFVAAPVLGRPDVAAAGQLGIVPGGPPGAIARCQPLFDVIGRRCFPAGDAAEAAASIKIANNFVLGCAIEAMGEAFALVRRHGVEPAALYEVMTDALFASPAYRIYGDIIAREDYDRVGITAVLGLKDANLALTAAEAVNMPLPSANVWRDRLLGAIAHGDGERDWAVVALEQARASGLE